MGRKQGPRQGDRARALQVRVHRAAWMAILDLADREGWTISRSAEWLIIRGVKAEGRGQAMRRCRERQKAGDGQKRLNPDPQPTRIET